MAADWSTAAEPTGGIRHAQIPDADRDSVRPVPA
jgi:hypothetical protein